MKKDFRKLLSLRKNRQEQARAVFNRSRVHILSEMPFKGKRPIFDKIIDDSQFNGDWFMQFKRRKLLPASAIATVVAALALPQQALAQGSPLPGSPMPGENSGYGSPASYDAAPVPGGYRPATGSVGQTAGGSHQVPGGLSNQAGGQQHQGAANASSIYHSLPLNAEEARIRLEDLSNRLAVSRPDDVKDSIYALSDWLQDVADAHWRMYKAFEKVDSAKAQANKEKEIGLRFSSLKNRAKLLKADLLIKQNRYPEALGPLVEIVTAEPTSATGQDAYKRLVDMGFSEQVAHVELADKATGKK